MIRKCGWVLAVVLPLAAQQPPLEKRAIETAKRIPVSQLEPGLPKQPLEEWLARAAGPGAKLEWEVNDCGEQTGSPADAGRDFPFCAQATAKLPDGRSANVSIVMGTFHRGFVGKPQVFDITVVTGDRADRVRKLRDLPARIRR